MQTADIKQINVKVEKPYTIFIKNNMFNYIKDQLKDERVFIITDSNVYNFYKDLLYELSDFVHAFEAGEESKNYSTLLKIYDFLIESGADRYSSILGIGGGVVGDIAGFAASTYMRGIKLYHVPTTLLAMVDSSIGGKTGINYHGLKNIVGSFYQPNAVFVDISLLKTLPKREYISAFAEIIKYGIIMDYDLFEFLERNAEGILKRKTELLQVVVEKSIKNKVKVVEKDEKEKGLRAILNFGHTFAHAIESITDYSRYLHGEAVAIGMVKALEVSYKMDLIKKEDIERVKALLKKIGLPTEMDGKVETSRMLNIMLKDKKNKNTSLRFVLTRGIGSSIIASGVKDKLILDVIGENREKIG